MILHIHIIIRNKISILFIHLKKKGGQHSKFPDNSGLGTYVKGSLYIREEEGKIFYFYIGSVSNKSNGGIDKIKIKLQFSTINKII